MFEYVKSKDTFMSFPMCLRTTSCSHSKNSDAYKVRFVGKTFCRRTSFSKNICRNAAIMTLSLSSRFIPDELCVKFHFISLLNKTCFINKSLSSSFSM